MPEEEGPKRALIVSAHPDDSEFGAAGTSYLWSKQGWEFYYCICTDGSKGSEDPKMTRDVLVPLRKEEQRAAAAVVGGKDVVFLDHVDGELTYNRDFMKEIVRIIRTLKPYAVFSHDPGQIVRNMFINHPDHRAVGETVLDAVYPMARNRPTFPELLDEGLEPYSVKEVYLWTASETNFDVDITDVLDVKFEALSKHASQLEDFEGTKERMKLFWRDTEGRYVERFRRIMLPF
ncbi:MAG: PIG-L deacetylase family protein [Chloroflexota bacterium]